MDISAITTEIKNIAEKKDTVGATFKFVFTDVDQVIHIDSTGQESVVTNEDLPADCEMHMKTKTFEKLKGGNLNPMMAVMTGKIKIKGDMGVAMKLQSFL